MSFLKQILTTLHEKTHTKKKPNFYHDTSGENSHMLLMIIRNGKDIYNTET